MKLHYYPETDSLYIEFLDRDSCDSREIDRDVVLDFDGEGNIVGIDIDRASERIDLETIEAIDLPQLLVRSSP